VKTYRIYQVDAFTKDRSKGNPAGVVLDADGLSDSQMQAIAREMNNAETAFVLSPSASDKESAAADVVSIDPSTSSG